MINQKNHKTFFDKVKDKLTWTVLDYATPLFAFEAKYTVMVTFEVKATGETVDLVFDSLAHVELFAESCAKYPDLVEAKFEKRMVK